MTSNKGINWFFIGIPSDFSTNDCFCKRVRGGSRILRRRLTALWQLFGEGEIGFESRMWLSWKPKTQKINERQDITFRKGVWGGGDLSPKSLSWVRACIFSGSVKSCGYKPRRFASRYIYPPLFTFPSGDSCILWKLEQTRCRRQREPHMKM